MAHTGNWDVEQLDLNGDSDFLDTDEHDDDRTHNKVNEITARDTDDDGTDDFTLSWDVAGNLADDGEEYECVYDAWSRLREVRATSDQSLVAEYRYNGIDQRIAMHADTDDDGDVDGGDEWHYLANGLGHKILAVFVDSDVYPAEQHVHHEIGPFKGGLYPPRRIVFRDRDTNATGMLNERLYYGSSWSSDVSTVFTGAGRPKEHVRYTAHGVSFGLPGGDLDSSGGADQADVDAIQNLIDSSLYSANADLDLDGDVDSTDKATAEIDFDGLTLGHAELSGVDVDNRYAWRGGYKLSKSLLGLGLSYHSVLGRDLRRYKTDPLVEQRNAGTRASSVAVNLGANAAAQTASPPHSPGGGLGEVGHVGDPPGGGATIVPCGGAVTAHLTGFGYGEGANCVEAVEDAISNKIQDTFECDFCDLYQKCDLVAFDGSGPFGQDCQDKHGPQLSPVGGGPSTGVAATVGFGQGGFIVTVYCAECP